MDKILRQNLFAEKMSVMRCLFIHQIISDELKHNVGVRPSIQIWMKLSYSAKVELPLSAKFPVSAPNHKTGIQL